jgi:hypothetical protein
MSAWMALPSVGRCGQSLGVAVSIEGGSVLTALQDHLPDYASGLQREDVEEVALPGGFGGALLGLLESKDASL